MLHFKFLNHSFGRIVADDTEELMSIWEGFSFYVPGYRFMPSYERGTWDGKIHLVNLSKKTFPVGLLAKFQAWCDDVGIKYNVDSKFIPKSILDASQVRSFICSKKYYSKGEEIFPRESQIESIIRSIQMKRCINICPTSFGKSLCIFIQALYHLETYGHKVVIVVPNVNLVRQFTNDIKDYCTGSEAVELPVVQQIFSGLTKDVGADTDIVVTTWQSIYKLPSEWINQFGLIVLDEAHKGSANCIRKVFEQATEVKYRTGWTGSLKESSLVEIQAEALIGPVKTITTTAELMDAGVVANLTIMLTRFEYKQSQVNEFHEYMKTKQEMTGKNTYPDEIKFLETNRHRSRTILRMADCFGKTGMLLYTHLAHGKDLYEMAREMFPKKTIYRIDGSVVERNGVKYGTYEELKGEIESEKNAMLICSFGVFSTGVSIKNIHYIVFTIPVKSYVRTVQSIGRGLRVSNSKNAVVLVDVIDDLCGKNKSGKKGRENYAYKHFRERFSTYADQKFKYKLTSIQIENV